MKTQTLAFLFLLGAAAQPAHAQLPAPVLAPPPAADANGHGLTSGAPGAMRAEAGAELEVAQAAIDLPQPQTRGDITYLCGGIGQAEAAYMNRQARAYDLKLTFAGQDGAFLADVHVEISTARGDPVLQAHCDGPIMLVDLPRSGSYRIQADAAGFTQSRNVRVDKDRARSVVVTWPQQAVAQMGTPAPATGSGPATSASGAGTPEDEAPPGRVQRGRTGSQEEPASGSATGAGAAPAGGGGSGAAGQGTR